MPNIKSIVNPPMIPLEFCMVISAFPPTLDKPITKNNTAPIIIIMPKTCFESDMIQIGIYNVLSLVI